MRDAPTTTSGGSARAAGAGRPVKGRALLATTYPTGYIHDMWHRCHIARAGLVTAPPRR